MLSKTNRLSYKKPLVVLLIASLMMHLAAYLIIPILPIILKNDKLINPAQIGTVIAAGTIAFQLGSIISGFLSDRIEKKYVMTIGAAIQALSIFGFSLFSTYSILILLSGGHGFGHGFTAPTVKAAIAGLTSDETDERTTAFSIRGIVSNIGTSIAGIILLFLANRNIFFITSLVYGALALLTLFLMSKEEDGKKKSKANWSDYKTIIKNKSFLFFAIVILLVNLGFAQLHFLLPLRAEAILNNNQIVGTVWTVISIEVILLQSLISKRFLTKYHCLTSVFWSLLFFSGGIFLIGLSHSFYILILSAIVFTVGQMLFMPITDSMIGKLAGKELLGAYFSLANLISGLGTGLGIYFSGLIINRFGIIHNSFPWMIISITLIALAFLVLFIKKLKLTDPPQDSQTCL
jgi:MFS family permease